MKATTRPAAGSKVSFLREVPVNLDEPNGNHWPYGAAISTIVLPDEEQPSDPNLVLVERSYHVMSNKVYTSKILVSLEDIEVLEEPTAPYYYSATAKKINGRWVHEVKDNASGEIVDKRGTAGDRFGYVLALEPKDGRRWIKFEYRRQGVKPSVSKHFKEVQLIPIYVEH